MFSANRILFLVLTAALVCQLPRVARAEPLRLTVAKGFELAAAHSHAGKQRGAEERAARARVDQARGAAFPQLDLTARYSRVQEVQPEDIELPAAVGGATASFGEAISSFTVLRGAITQPVFNGFGIRRRHEAAALSVDLARERSRETQAELRLQVEELYFGLYLALEFEAVTRQSLSAVDAHLTRVRSLHLAGRATDLDVAHTEAQLADAELSLEEARGNVQSAQAAFVALLGLPPGADIELTDAPEEPGAIPAALADAAVATRPELGVARVAARAENKQVAIARAALWPTVSLQAGYTYANPNERYFPPQQEFNGAWDASILMNWKLDWGITSSQVAEARHAASAAQHRVAALEEQTRVEAAQTDAALSTSARRIKAARKALAAAERALVAAERLFELGRLDSTALLDRELDLRRARARLLGALVDHRLAAARARRLADSRPNSPGTRRATIPEASR